VVKVLGAGGLTARAEGDVWIDTVGDMPVEMIVLGKRPDSALRSWQLPSPMRSIQTLPISAPASSC